jgi:hypothetical protein
MYTSNRGVKFLLEEQKNNQKRADKCIDGARKVDRIPKQVVRGREEARAEVNPKRLKSD